MPVRDPDPKAVLSRLEREVANRGDPVVSLPIEGGSLLQPLDAAGPTPSRPIDLHSGVSRSQVIRGIDSRRQRGAGPALDRGDVDFANLRGTQISDRDRIAQPARPPDVAKSKLDPVVAALARLDSGGKSPSLFVKYRSLRNFDPIEQDRGSERLTVLPGLQAGHEDDPWPLAVGAIVDVALRRF